MFNRIGTGFQLAMSSWAVLRGDKKLLLFPFLSGIGCLLVLASFLTPMLLNPHWFDFLDSNKHQQLPVWTYLVAFAFYFCNYFVVVFFNSALVSCALIRLNGGEPTAADGLSAAASRLPQIVAWSLVSATVGMILKAIENAHEKVGAIISAILGTGWTILTFFVVPVLVVENVGPLQAIQRSMAILRQTWGESLGGRLGMDLFLFLLALPGIVLLIGGGYLVTTNMVVGVTLMVAGGIYLLIDMAVASALNMIFLAALYQFAVKGQVSGPFDESCLRGAFTAK